MRILPNNSFNHFTHIVSNLRAWAQSELCVCAYVINESLSTQENEFESQSFALRLTTSIYAVYFAEYQCLVDKLCRNGIKKKKGNQRKPSHTTDIALFRWMDRLLVLNCVIHFKLILFFLFTHVLPPLSPSPLASRLSILSHIGHVPYIIWFHGWCFAIYSWNIAT